MEKIGLVLAGGGGKGSYQIGVWKALIELGIDKKITSISGTSIGALNAFGIAIGDYDTAESLWLNSSPKQFLSKDILESLKRCNGLSQKEIYDKLGEVVEKHGYAPRDGLIKVLDDSFDFKKITNSNRNIYNAAYNITNSRIEYINIAGKDKEEIKKVLCASSALPNVYSPVFIGEKEYVDGGVKDNNPIKPLYDEGIRDMILVHFHHDDRLRLKRFKGLNLLEIIPSGEEEDLINGTLDFSAEGASRRIKKGYDDALKILKENY